MQANIHLQQGTTKKIEFITFLRKKMNSNMFIENYLQAEIANKTVALVGNGEITENQTKFIDAHDVVIRFNNLVYFNNPKTGKKFTHWANNRDKDLYVAMKLLKYRSRRALMLLYPDKFDCKSSLERKSIDSLQLAQKQQFNQVYYQENNINTGLDARPRIGFMLASILSNFNI